MYGWEAVAPESGLFRLQTIWDHPKPIPGMQTDVGFQETMKKLVKQVQGEPTSESAKMKKHNEEIESKKRLAQVSKATRARRREGSR